MKRIALTPQQQKEIYEMYLDEANSVRDIADAYDINASTVSKTALKLGAPPRNVKAVKSRVTRTEVKTSTIKTCSTCKKHVGVPGAAFCPYRGADIRSPKQLLVQRISSIMPKLKFLSEGVKDEMQRLLTDLKTELSKE